MCYQLYGAILGLDNHISFGFGKTNLTSTLTCLADNYMFYVQVHGDPLAYTVKESLRSHTYRDYMVIHY